MRRGYVRRPSERVQTFDRLVRIDERAKNRDAPFETYRDLLVFAACVGFAHGERVQYDKSEHTIAWEQFANRLHFEGLIYALGIAETKDTSVLSEDQSGELIRIFEEYANGGLEIIEDWLNQAPTDDYREILTNRILSRLGDVSDDASGFQPRLVEPTF